MCDPISAIGMGLSIAGSVSQFSAKQQQTEAYNAAAKQNGINASVAASNAYADEGRKYIYDMRKTQQEGYQATMKGREAIGTGQASAGASGFDASSLSIADIMSNEAQRTAFNIDNIHTKQDDRTAGLKSSLTGIEAQAQGRINQMPFKEGPDPMGLMINIASAGFEGAKSGKLFG